MLLQVESASAPVGKDFTLDLPVASVIMAVESVGYTVSIVFVSDKANRDKLEQRRFMWLRTASRYPMVDGATLVPIGNAQEHHPMDFGESRTVYLVEIVAKE